MKILKSGNGPKRLTGECECGTVVQTDTKEAKILVDRDSPNGAHYVKCPNCKAPYLWVK